MASRLRPLVVIILDGWGISFVKEGNAIMAAQTPYMNGYARYFPSAALKAASIEVGLPWGEVGNSETGHRNIGAGQVQYQALPMIDKAIGDGSFYTNPAFLQAIEHANKNNSNLHIMGMASAGGVHAHVGHIQALIELCRRQNFSRVFIHVFTDGRDTAPKVAESSINLIQQSIDGLGVGAIATVTGRFYAMDRNNNWDRTQATYNVLTNGPRASGAPSAKKAIDVAYASGLDDEHILPTAITRGGEPIGFIQSNDAIIFTNFRPDRARQITRVFIKPETAGFPIQPLTNLFFVSMTHYDNDLPTVVAFQEEHPQFPLARVISDAGLKQLHIAETEKYAHITYYLNAGYEDVFPGEERFLVESSSVQDFAEKPEMGAREITAHTKAALEKGIHDVYFLNFANPDMVGHSGSFEATVTACSIVDECIGIIHKATMAAGGALIVTADHGNAEDLRNPLTQEREKDHSSNAVPFHFVYPTYQRKTPKSDQEIMSIFSTPVGVLADIAPTVLEVLGLPKPAEMTGVSLMQSLK